MPKGLLFLLLCLFGIIGATEPEVVPDSVQSVVDSTPVRSVPLQPTFAAKSDSLEAAMKVAALNKVLNSQGANDPMVATKYTPPSLGKLALRMALGLVVVLGLMYFLYRTARKARGMDVKPGELPTRSLQVLESAFVGPNQKVVLLRLGTERVLVVGSTPSQVTALAEVQGPEALEMIGQQRQTSVITPAQFSETVNHLLRRFRKDGGSP